MRTPKVEKTFGVHVFADNKKDTIFALLKIIFCDSVKKFCGYFKLSYIYADIETRINTGNKEQTIR